MLTSLLGTNNAVHAAIKSSGDHLCSGSRYRYCWTNTVQYYDVVIDKRQNMWVKRVSLTANEKVKEGI